MSLKSKTFLVRKGEGIDDLTVYLNNSIGLDAFLIKSISSTPLNDTVTQLTVIYQEYPDNVIDSYAPRPGAIIPTGVTNSGFDIRLIFNSPIDSSSILSGTFLIDNIGLPATKSNFLNSYFCKINLSGYDTSGFHEFRIDNTKINRLNGSKFDYSPVGGYVVNSLASAHLGDWPTLYSNRRRGTVKADVIRSSKGNSPQQLIEEYLSNRSIDKNQLLAYTFVSRNNNLTEVYFVFIDRLEPQIIEGYPLTNTVIPNESSIEYVTLVFSTELDKGYIESTSGLFSIESDFYTSTPVNYSDVSVSSDLKTVRIDLTSYIYSDRIYSILVNSGLKSKLGVIKQKPEQWVLNISEYKAVVGSSNVSASGSGAPIEAEYILNSSHPDLPSSYVVSSRSGVQISAGGGQLIIGLTGGLYTGITGHISNTANPHATTYSQVGAPSLQDFTGHTGETGIHFTQSQISIPSSQIYDFSGAVAAIASTLSGVSNEIFTGHTGDLSIHYTQAQINITSSQVSDFSEAAQDAVGGIFNPLSGIQIIYSDGTPSITISLSGFLYTGILSHLSNTSVHFTEASIKHTNISDIGTYTHDDIDTHINDTSNPHGTTYTQVGAPSIASFTGHTGDISIHYTQGSISITSSQISDFTESTQDTVAGFISYGSGITGIYNDGGNQLTLSGIFASNTIYGISKFNSTDFTVSNGNVSWTRSLVFDDLTDVDLTNNGGPVVGDIIYFDGSDWTNTGFGDIAGLQPANNLLDVSNIDTSRKNLKVRYYIDDLSPHDSNGVWTSTSTTSGSSYQLDAYFASHCQSKDCIGVVATSNGLGSNSDQGSLRYHNNLGLYLATGICYYFRVSISTTSNALFRFGLTYSNHTATGDVADGVYFEYNSSTNAYWLACNASGSSRTKATTSTAAASNSWKWFGIEWVNSGAAFYDCDSGSTPIYVLTESEPGVDKRAMRAFTQSIGNGGTYRTIYLDKFAYPLYADYLPSGIA